MIDWGTTPVGTVGTLYLPGVSSVEVVGLADRLYTRNRLEAVDEHSVQVEVTGRVSYVPVPAGGIGDLAGLLTLDLPPNVKRGQRFRVVMHQVIDAPPLRPRPVVTDVPRDHGLRAAHEAIVVEGNQAAVDRRPRPSRHIVGSFQFSVLVQARAEILPIIERTLVNLRRVTGTIPLENRWHAVMHRYLDQVTAKFDALGGKHDHDHDHEHEHERHALEGKIAGVRFDAFGDFEGFLLRTRHGVHNFWTRERDMEVIITRAWREQIAIRVVAKEHHREEPAEIIFLRPSIDEDDDD
jgi:hypothetical protein